MERRRRPEPPPTPPPHPPPSPFLHDISNYKTPLPHFRNPNPYPSPSPNPSPLFFTASRNTPSSSRSSFRRKPFAPSLPQSRAARRLKALELEQSKSARKAETRKAKNLKSFTRSVTAWLNFLFENPKECGCGVGMGSDGGRGWKRLRSCEEEEEVGVALSAERVSVLRDSLKDVCSLEDLRARMEGYMSKKACNEVLSIMSRLCKNIDGGRLKMKAHCPIVTDLALKEKSTRVLMCYNATWLRIGLHIVLGGDSLLNEGRESDQEDIFLKLIVENQFFTHMVIAKSYAYNKLVDGLYKPGFFEALGSIILKRFLLLVISLDRAKCESALPLKCGIDGKDGGSPLLFSPHSHIKSSRQAVQEFLSEVMHGEGDLLSHLVILGCKLNYQQFSLAEYEFKITRLFDDLQDGIMLCRAIQLLKSDASILSKVAVPSNSHKKRLQNCSTAMHYLKQAGVSLSDGDGIQMASEDIVNGDQELVLSVLWNMFLHLQVPLLIDRILLAKEIAKLKGSDVVLLDHERKNELELLLSWVKRRMGTQDDSPSRILLLKKAYNCKTYSLPRSVCERQCIEVGGFSSIIEGKALCCLVDYYFRNEVCRYSSKEYQVQCGEELNMDFDTVTTDEVHYFAFIQSVTAIPGNFPKVFQLSDMLDQDAPYDERSVVILLVFLASRLICRKNVDDFKCKSTQQNYRYTDLKSSIVPQTLSFKRTPFTNNKFRGKNLLECVTPLKKSRFDKERAAFVIQAHFRGFTARKKFLKIKMAESLRGRAASVIQSHFRRFNERKNFFRIRIAACRQERAASVIQSHFRGFSQRKKFMKMKMAACFVQTAVRAWLAITSKCKLNSISSVASVHPPSYGTRDGYLMFMIERHRFFRIRKSVIHIQQAARAWFIQKRQRKDTAKYSDSSAAVISIQSFVRGQIVRARYVDMLAIVDKKQERAAFVIQAHFRGFTARKKFLKIKMAESLRGHLLVGRAASVIQSHFRRFNERKKFLRIQIAACRQESAASVIQSHLRGFTQRKKFMKIKMAACFVQTAVRAWLAVTSKCKFNNISSVAIVHPPSYGTRDRYLMFMIERHRFFRIRKSVIHIQQAARAWFIQKRQRKDTAKYSDSSASVISIQSFVRGQIVRARYVDMLAILDKKQCTSPKLEDQEHLCMAAIKIQSAWKSYTTRTFHAHKRFAAIRIQSCWRGWYSRKHFVCQVAAVIEIQAGIRGLISQKTFNQFRFAATEIQRFARGQLARKRLLGASHLHYGRSLIGSNTMTTTYQSYELKIIMDSILKLQRWWKQVSRIKSRTISAISIQSSIYGWNASRTTWKKRQSVSKIQRWWRNILLLKLKKKSVILIQAHVRGWITRRAAERDKHNIVVIQSYWKGYVVRKNSREKVADLRFRLQKSSVVVDESKRLINRLVAALSELLGYKSVSNIRHTCATLNTATELSQRCCETLVSAGAIDILLKQFHSLNRGVPDQEVLKHVVSTLSNISSYPQLLQVLIDTPQAVEIVFQEFLRNKSDVFFVTYELLKRLCATHNGLVAIRRLHVHVRRLNSLVRDLERKSELQKRNARLCTAKDNTVRRLKAAADLMLLISDDCS